MLAAAPASAQYGYNGDGERVSETEAGTTQDLDWDNQTEPTPVLLSDSDASYIYGPYGLPVEQISASGVVTYLHHDALGSTRLLTNTKGAVVGTMSYGPYGEATSETGGVYTPLQWAGQLGDPSSGLYYLQARYYDPATAQFLSMDPEQINTNAGYTYASDDPLDESDPTGLCSTGSLTDLLDCVNPVSSGNLAYQLAKTISDHTPIKITWFLSQPPVVDATAGLVCAAPGVDLTVCGPAIAFAAADSTSENVATGIATDWCDPAQLVASEVLDTLLASGGAVSALGADLAENAPGYIVVILRGVPLVLYNGLDAAREASGG
jgi:RHS repeat-associated protein